MRIIVSLIIFGISFVLIRYSFQIVQMFGHIDIVEEKIGSGTSYIFLKVLGVIGILLGIAYLFGRISFGPSI